MKPRLCMVLFGAFEAEMPALVHTLESDGYAVLAEHVAESAAVRETLEARVWDLMIADVTRIAVPDIFALLKDAEADLPLIAVADSSDLEAATAALKAGAADCVRRKDAAQLALAVYRVLHNHSVRYRQISDLMSDYAYLFRSMDGTCTEREWIAGAFVQAVGSAPGEAGWLDRVHPEDRSRVQEHTQRLLSGKPSSVEFRIYTKGDELRWVYDRGRPYLDAEGTQVVRIYGAGKDITARKHMEELLRHERDLLSRIMEIGPAAISIVDRKGQIIFANRRAEWMLGLNRDKITQRVYNAPVWKHTRFDGSPFPDEEQPFRRVMETGKPVYDVRQAIEHPDGRRVMLSINGAPLLDETGQVDRVVFIMEDITARREAEAALEKSQKQLQAIFDNAQDGILLADDAACYIDANPAICEMTGYSRDELVGMSVYDLTPETAVETGEDLWHTFLKEGKQRGEYTLLGKDGTLMEVEYQAVAHIVPGVHLSTLRDITARKRASGARRREMQRMEQLSAPPQAHITAETFGLVPLHRATSVTFDKLMATYENLLDKALEEQAYKIENSVSESLQAMAEQLGMFRAGPRDVVEIHTLALKNKIEEANPVKAQAYTEEGRLMVLKLMGYLLAYYRDYFVDAWRMDVFPQDQEDN